LLGMAGSLSVGGPVDFRARLRRHSAEPGPALCSEDW
jgi:hypothetical protein